jgi:hypothetical protein
MIDEAAIRLRWDVVGSRLDERGRRLFAAAEVRTAGRGGLAMVSKITGLARSTINRGKQDLDTQPLPKGRVRRAGGGRRSVCENDPGLIPALKRLVEPATLGDPMRPLIWVSKSMEKLAATLTQMGHPISADTVCTELVKLGFSRQSNRKANDSSKASRPQRSVRPHQREGRCGGSTSTTIRRAHQSGTRSSTGCSATSRRTGAAGRSPIGSPWSS